MYGKGNNIESALPIPEKMAGCVEYHFRKGTIASRLRELDVGDFAEFPLDLRQNMHKCASQIGIKIATRQMGSRDSFRCYRVE